MTWVLEEVKQKGGFFLDSRTSSRSVGYTVAKDLGLPAFRRSIFLDNVQDRRAIRIQLRKLVAQAKKHGWAIGIGHVYPTTCQALKSEYGYLASQVDLVPITELLR